LTIPVQLRRRQAQPLAKGGGPAKVLGLVPTRAPRFAAAFEVLGHVPHCKTQLLA